MSLHFIENPYDTPEFLGVDLKEVTAILSTEKNLSDKIKEVRNRFNLTLRQVNILRTYHVGRRYFRWNGKNVQAITRGKRMQVDVDGTLFPAEILDCDRFIMTVLLNGEEIEFDLGTRKSLCGKELFNF